MRKFALVLALALLATFLGGQVYVLSPQNNGGIPTTVLSGAYTVATLPPASANQARYAFVTDLGGGADMVLSDGTNWKHIRQGVVTNVPIASTVTITPLSSPPIMQLTSSTPYVGAASINISATNLYVGYVVHIITPSGVLSTATGALGTLGVNVAGVSAAQALPLVGGMWEDVQWNGTQLVELGRGTL